MIRMATKFRVEKESGLSLCIIGHKVEPLERHTKATS
jgi:hypothetical protein